jgi:hypothetical protein
VANPFDEAEKRVKGEQGGGGGGNPFDVAEQRIVGGAGGGGGAPPPGFWSQMALKGATAVPATIELGGLSIADIGKGALKGAASTISNVTSFAPRTSFLRNMSELLKKSGATTPTTPSQEAGFGAEQVGEFFLPIPGAAELDVARLATKSRFLKALYGASREFLRGSVIGTAQTGDVKKGLEAGAVATPFGAVAEGTRAFAKPLRESAEKTYARVLSPTTKPTKFLTQKILSDEGGVGRSLLDRRIMAFTERGMEKKLATRLAKATTDLEAEYAKLGPKAKVNVLPILDDIQEYAERKSVIPIDPAQQIHVGKATVAGKPGNVGSPELYESAQQVQMSILNELAPKMETASLDSVTALRRIYDLPLAKKAFFSGNIPSSVRDQMEKAGADAMRRAIASEHPSIAQVNAEYSFWKSAKDVMGAAIQRKTGQEGLLKRVMPRMTGAAVGGLVGYRQGGVTRGVEDALLVGAGYTVFEHILQSPAWRTVSAVGKNEVARMLAAGRGEAATTLAARLAARASVVRREQ